MSQEEASVSWAPQLTDLLRSKIARASVRLQHTLAIFIAFEVVRVCAGKAAIARVLTGVGALMRVPVVSGVMVYHYVIKPKTIVSIPKNFVDFRANSFIIF